MYADEIARGVVVLNERVPDWRARLDVDQLDLSRATACVVGQVMNVRSITPVEDDPAASWAGAIAALSDVPAGPRGYTSLAQRRWSVKHGFDTDRVDGSRYSDLTAAWKDYLRSEALV